MSIGHIQLQQQGIWLPPSIIRLNTQIYSQSDFRVFGNCLSICFGLKLRWERLHRLITEIRVGISRDEQGPLAHLTVFSSSLSRKVKVSKEPAKGPSWLSQPNFVSTYHGSPGEEQGCQHHSDFSVNSDLKTGKHQSPVTMDLSSVLRNCGYDSFMRKYCMIENT